MTDELKTRLEFLAEKYEVSSFCDEDPSQFLNRYTDVPEAEAASFIAAMFSFGNRKQFIPKIRFILDMADKNGGLKAWLSGKKFLEDFKNPDGGGDKKFYRFYSWNDISSLLLELSDTLVEGSSFGDAVRKSYEKKTASKDPKAIDRNGILVESIQEFFPRSSIVPKGRTGANKRIHMFLRWAVRSNSPVDKGFWNWFSAEDLLIPLDTHVMQESVRLGLIPQKSTCSLKTARLLTDRLKEVWKDDPCRGDFALFGLGVGENEKKS